MDLNIFLLDSKEQHLLQEISLNTCNIFGQDFCFNNTRDGVDVIIIETDKTAIRSTLGNDIPDEEIDFIIKKCCNEKDQLEYELKNEEQIIRNVIEEEQKRRREYGGEEEWPHLPNYEDPEGFEPRNIDWDNLPYDAINELEKENGKELDAIIENILNAKHYYPRVTKLITNDVQKYLTTGGYENFFVDSISNYHLMLLDDRIRQLRLYRARLYANNLLGYFTRYYDVEGKEERRTIRLLLDNIGTEAKALGVNKIEVLANVFIHELFHAYFSESLIKRYAWVNCINEIEEAMAEFGMLGYMQQNYPHYLPTAERSVRKKLNHPNLWHYGLGSILFDVFRANPSASGFFNDRVFMVYQVVQMSLRNDKNRIKLLKSLFNANTFDSYGAIALIFKLFTIYYPLRNDGRTHHYFNGSTYGHNNKMAYSVFDYYIQRNHPVMADIIRDFPRTCGRNPHPGLLDIINANHNRYDFNVQYKLADGTVVVPRKEWTSTNDGDVFAFMIEVDRLYKRGILDRHVLYLG